MVLDETTVAGVVLLQCRYYMWIAGRVSKRYDDIAQPALVADAAYRGTFHAAQKLVF